MCLPGPALHDLKREYDDWHMDSEVRPCGHSSASVSRPTALALLVAQNSMLVMTIRYSRANLPEPEGNYHISTAVVLVEAIKLLICFSIATCDFIPDQQPRRYVIAVRALYHSIFSPDCWKLFVLAALYTIQNNLVYVAISNMETVPFQVTYQLKILTTAVFSVLLLGKRLASHQWLSLALLTVGAAIVQVPECMRSVSRFLGNPSGRVSSYLLHSPAPSTQEQHLASSQAPQSIPADFAAIKGLLSVVAASSISGFAGVYFEKLVKDSSSTSVWVRNLQLSLFSLPSALVIGVLVQDGESISRRGFFAGYSFVVWSTIFLQALGGLLVAMVIKSADNLAKNFATSLSIVVCQVASLILFNEPLTLNSSGGAVIVLIALYLYQKYKPPISCMAKETDIEICEEKRQH